MNTQIIADACCNHLGDRKIIKHMIEVAAGIGIDTIKFQSFRAAKLNKNYPNAEYWQNYYKQHELSLDDHEFILKTCEDNKIGHLFTVFTPTHSINITLDTLHSIGVKNIKIASPDANNWELICQAMNMFDNVIISTGMHTDLEIKELRYIIKRANNNVQLLYCVSKYPTEYQEIDFDKMLYFDGFSDHTPDIRASLKAIDIGMPMIERHFTLGKYLPGKDHMLSSTPDEFAKLVDHRSYLEKCNQYKLRWRSE